jgi:hypothetical protein
LRSGRKSGGWTGPQSEQRFSIVWHAVKTERGDWPIDLHMRPDAWLTAYAEIAMGCGDQLPNNAETDAMGFRGWDRTREELREPLRGHAAAAIFHRQAHVAKGPGLWLTQTIPQDTDADSDHSGSARWDRQPLECRGRITDKIDENPLNRILGDTNLQRSCLTKVDLDLVLLRHTLQQTGAALDYLAEVGRVARRFRTGSRCGGGKIRCLRVGCAAGWNRASADPLEQPFDRRLTASANQTQVLRILTMFGLENSRAGEQVTVESQGSNEVSRVMHQAISIFQRGWNAGFERSRIRCARGYGRVEWGIRTSGVLRRSHGLSGTVHP